MSLTLKQTFKRCQHMWAWLANNPGQSKRDYFARYDIRPLPVLDCWFCEYTTQFSIDGYVVCSKCPGEALWRTGKAYACERAGNGRNHYERWKSGTPFNRARQARIIANYCTRALKRLAKKGQVNG